MRKCEVCGTPFTGRPEKRFCDPNCKTTYHNMMRSINAHETRRIDQFLHRNRTILMEIYKKKNESLFLCSKIQLLKMGFKFEYFTSSYSNHTGKKINCMYEFTWYTNLEHEIVVKKRRFRKPLHPILYESNINQDSIQQALQEEIKTPWINNLITFPGQFSSYLYKISPALPEQQPAQLICYHLQSKQKNR